MKWLLKCIRVYANFKGRASVDEYKLFAIINLIIVGGVFLFADEQRMKILGVYGLFMLLPAIAIGVRRLNDFETYTPYCADDCDIPPWVTLTIVITFYGLLLLFILLLSFTSMVDSYTVLSFLIAFGFISAHGWAATKKGYEGKNYHGEPKKHKTKAPKCTMCRQETLSSETVISMQQLEMARNTVQSVMRAMEVEQKCGYRCRNCGKIYCKNCIDRYGTVACPKCFGPLEYT